MWQLRQLPWHVGCGTAYRRCVINGPGNSRRLICRKHRGGATIGVWKSVLERRWSGQNRQGLSNRVLEVLFNWRILPSKYSGKPHDVCTLDGPSTLSDISNNSRNLTFGQSTTNVVTDFQLWKVITQLLLVQFSKFAMQIKILNLLFAKSLVSPLHVLHSLSNKHLIEGSYFRPPCMDMRCDRTEKSTCPFWHDLAWGCQGC